MCGPNLHYARCLLCIPDILETNCRLSGTRAADASLGTFGRPHRARSICSAKSRKSSHLDASGIQISGRYRGGGGRRWEGGRRQEGYTTLHPAATRRNHFARSVILLLLAPSLFLSLFSIFIFFFRFVVRRGITGK